MVVQRFQTVSVLSQEQGYSTEQNNLKEGKKQAQHLIETLRLVYFHLSPKTGVCRLKLLMLFVYHFSVKLERP